MLNLQDRFKQQTTKPTSVRRDRVSVRDRLLIQEVAEVHNNLPSSCTLNFPQGPSCLSTFELIICPNEGYWVNGRFVFQVDVPLDYNMVPPNVKCRTKVWHPNISEDGSICLSLLRPTSVDGMGWAPTRKLTDVIWGLNSLFSDLLDFDDPLNIEAAELFRRSMDLFLAKVKDYIRKYCYQAECSGL